MLLILDGFEQCLDAIVWVLARKLTGFCRVESLYEHGKVFILFRVANWLENTLKPPSARTWI
jgi:hypothetical protein